MFCERHRWGKLFSHIHTLTLLSSLRKQCTVLILLVFSCTTDFTTCLLLNFSIESYMDFFWDTGNFFFPWYMGTCTSMFVFWNLLLKKFPCNWNWRRLVLKTKTLGFSVNSKRCDYFLPRIMCACRKFSMMAIDDTVDSNMLPLMLLYCRRLRVHAFNLLLQQ